MKLYTLVKWDGRCYVPHPDHNPTNQWGYVTYIDDDCQICRVQWLKDTNSYDFAFMIKHKKSWI